MVGWSICAAEILNCACPKWVKTESPATQSRLPFLPYSGIGDTAMAQFGLMGPRRGRDSAPKLEPRIVRYELSDYEWTAIKPMPPNKPRGVRRVNDRRVLNGIFWVRRSGAPWRDLPENDGPYTTCCSLFVRWRQAGR
jgi:hypothetical protein